MKDDDPDLTLTISHISHCSYSQLSSSFPQHNMAHWRMTETEIGVDDKMYIFIYHSMMTMGTTAITEEAQKESVRKLINQGPAAAMFTSGNSTLHL